MSLPVWLFDELPDDDLVARATAWANLLVGAVEIDAAPSSCARRRALMQAQADAVHVRVPTGIEPECPACGGAELRRGRRVWVCTQCDGGRS